MTCGDHLGGHWSEMGCVACRGNIPRRAAYNMCNRRPAGWWDVAPPSQVGHRAGGNADAPGLTPRPVGLRGDRRPNQPLELTGRAPPTRIGTRKGAARSSTASFGGVEPFGHAFQEVLTMGILAWLLLGL